uniref:Uncharacterized protein n=1 Tax=Utricularia reniformis TaxID=192314 RepID=A0A1Y0B1K2_9LAMI|nr:hypothetical protein AEK19_MT1068 [Utricularia reniformis]ART31290.1 hypothetical protein AEK19_MT1068 [Utricularia reniformis]
MGLARLISYPYSLLVYGRGLVTTFDRSYSAILQDAIPYYSAL